jgi:hypothetical protein
MSGKALKWPKPSCLMDTFPVPGPIGKIAEHYKVCRMTISDRPKWNSEINREGTTEKNLEVSSKLFPDQSLELGGKKP